MWFKSVLVYRLCREISFDSLEEQLKEFSFSACSPSQASTSGWVSPFNQSSSLLHQPTNKISLLRCKTETKVLPGSAVKAGTTAKVFEMEKREGRTVRKKEAQHIKEDVTKALLERALSRETFIHVLIVREVRLTNKSGDHASETLIAIDSASSQKAEEVLSLLRKTLGSLPVVPLSSITPIENTLTSWVTSPMDIAGGFDVGSSAILQSVLDKGGEIRCKEQDIHSDEILIHIQHNKMVTSLQLESSSCKFTLKNDLSITKLSFRDEIKHQNIDIPREDLAARFDADLILFSDCFESLIGHLSVALGGVECGE